MVNSVPFGSGASAPDVMGGGFDSIRQSTAMLAGGGGHGSGDILSLSSHGQKKRPSVETIIKGAIAATAAVLGFKFLKGRGAAKAAKAAVK